MGEKFLAQRTLRLLRNKVGRTSREAVAALEWARDHRDWLWPGAAVSVCADAEPAAVEWDALASLATEPVEGGEPLPMFANIATAADLLALDAFDRQLLEAVAGFQQLPRLSTLRARLAQAGTDLIALLAQLAGAPASGAELRVRRSLALTLGLVSIEREPLGGATLELQWSFARLIDEGGLDEAKMVEGLAGIRQEATLTPEDFAHHEADFDLLVRLIRGAVRTGARGVNVLLHGPPGTGKTECARTLAAAVGASLFAVGEADADGDEPTRLERLNALNRAQRLLARRNDSLLLFDELEDLFDRDIWSRSGSRCSGSKIFVNRLLENVAVPVIWTTNSLGAVDPAHLRRFNYVLAMGFPSAQTRARIAARAAEAEGATAAVPGLQQLLRDQPESASVARVALRTAALAGGDANDAAAAGHALLRGIRGGRALMPRPSTDQLDLSLYEADVSIEDLAEQITAADGPLDFSLLLSGPPGTGKTELAGYFARRLDRPLRVKRASDLLSKWVGETEANIAEAFAAARDEGAVLLFDEADSLLLDRNDARHSWEITQVNELLTWMESHPLPFIAATNFAGRLDPAAFRRFLFKVELRSLSGSSLDRAFMRFFDASAPAGLGQLSGLTPGDFAVVKRQLRYCQCSPGEILDRLRREAEAKPGPSARLGF